MWDTRGGGGSAPTVDTDLQRVWLRRALENVSKDRFIMSEACLSTSRFSYWDGDGVTPRTRLLLTRSAFGEHLFPSGTWATNTPHSAVSLQGGFVHSPECKPGLEPAKTQEAAGFIGQVT